MKKIFHFFPIATLVLIFSACNSNTESATVTETKELLLKAVDRKLCRTMYHKKML